MDIEISKKLTNELVKKLTHQLFTFYHFPGNKINGESISTFSQHQQVNNFILFQIYQEWSAQSRRLSQSFFDFHHPDVKSAMKDFMAVLSQHVQIHKNDFKPLVEKAVFNSLKLISNPVTTLCRFFFLNVDEINIQVFEKNSHYFSDYGSIVGAVLKHFQNKGVSSIKKDDFTEKIYRAIDLFESKNQFNIRDYQQETLLKTFGINLEELKEREQEIIRESPETRPVDIPQVKNPISQETKAPEIIEEKTVSHPEPENLPVEEEPKTDHKQELEFKITTKPVVEESPVTEIPTPIEEVPPKQKKIEFSTRPVPVEEVKEKPIDLFGQKKEPIIQSEPKTKTLADSFSQKPSNLNDSLNKGSFSAESIPVHKQFQFVQKLFGGSTVKFKVVMGRLEESKNVGEAMEVIQKYIFNSPNVDPNDPVSQEFVSMVKNK